MVSLIVKALQKALVDQKLNTIIGLLEEAQGKENKIMATIAELEQQIRESVAVEQSAVLLIQGFKRHQAPLGRPKIDLASSQSLDKRKPRALLVALIPNRS